MWKNKTLSASLRRPTSLAQFDGVRVLLGAPYNHGYRCNGMISRSELKTMIASLFPAEMKGVRGSNDGTIKRSNPELRRYWPDQTPHEAVLAGCPTEHPISAARCMF